MNPWITRAICLALIFISIPAAAGTLRYTATLTNCTAPCDSFSSVQPEATFDVLIALPFSSDNVFVYDGNTVSLNGEFENAFAPIVDTLYGVGPACDPDSDILAICNPETANPMDFNTQGADVFGTAVLDIDAATVTGIITLRFTIDPFARNDAQIIIDLATGEAAFTMLDGAVTVATYAGDVNLDQDFDGDLVDNDVDNCIFVLNPQQVDTDGDGHGNLCDADFNNDCIVNAADLGLLRTFFFMAGTVADLNGDGIVAAGDLGVFRSLFFSVPGPSGQGQCNETP